MRKNPQIFLSFICCATMCGVVCAQTTFYIAGRCWNSSAPGCTTGGGNNGGGQSGNSGTDNNPGGGGENGENSGGSETTDPDHEDDLVLTLVPQNLSKSAGTYGSVNANACKLGAGDYTVTRNGETVSDATLQYRVGESGAWYDNIALGTNPDAGDYNIYVRAVLDGETTEGQQYTCTINKAIITAESKNVVLVTGSFAQNNVDEPANANYKFAQSCDDGITSTNPNTAQKTFKYSTDSTYVHTLTALTTLGNATVNYKLTMSNYNDKTDSYSCLLPYSTSALTKDSNNNWYVQVNLFSALCQTKAGQTPGAGVGDVGSGGTGSGATDIDPNMPGGGGGTGTSGTKCGDCAAITLANDDNLAIEYSLNKDGEGNVDWNSNSSTMIHRTSNGPSVPIYWRVKYDDIVIGRGEYECNVVYGS